MEMVLMNFSGDYNHRIGNPRRNFSINGLNRPLVSYLSDDFTPASFLAGGGVPYMLPPPLSHSYPPSVSVFPPQQNHQHNRRLQQPPLLPLPISTPPNHRNMRHSSHNIRLSSPSPPINKKVKNNRSRDQSKNQKKDSKKEGGSFVPPTSTEVVFPEKSSAINRMGPDPKDLPKDFISRALSSPINGFGGDVSGSVVFTTSPPPSSLPLPTFTLRPKLSCNAAAASVNAGATDDLRQLLRLR